jgi:two-component system phosphate regulon sensor histidine kinase PhoR
VASTKNRQRLGYRRIVTLLVYLIIVPTVLLLAVGIVLMFFGEVFNVLFGVLTVSFVGVLVTGVVLVLVFLRREANLSELQADFVSKVSHELRTPLTSIRLFVETLDRSQGNREVEAKCREALGNETDRLSRLIERLLDWGRMESGRYKFDLKDEPVQAIVDDAVETFSPIRYPDLELTTDVEPNVPNVYADRHAIADALVNLLSNAHKYGGTPPKVTLRAFAHQTTVLFEVTDNGEGIPQPEHRRIFEKFYRIDDRLSRAKEGSGLGLAIVNHIARAHRGRVVVESAKGQGSTFRLMIPATRKLATATEKADVGVKQSEA